MWNMSATTRNTITGQMPGAMKLKLLGEARDPAGLRVPLVDAGAKHHASVAMKGGSWSWR